MISASRCALDGLRHEPPHPRLQRPLQMPRPAVAGHDHASGSRAARPAGMWRPSHRPRPASAGPAPRRRAGAPAPSPAPPARRPPRRRPEVVLQRQQRGERAADQVLVVGEQHPYGHPGLHGVTSRHGIAASRRRTPCRGVSGTGLQRPSTAAEPPPSAGTAPAQRARLQRAVQRRQPLPQPGEPRARRGSRGLRSSRAAGRPSFSTVSTTDAARTTAQPDRAPPRVPVPQHVRRGLPDHPRRAPTAPRPAVRPPSPRVDRQSIPAAASTPRAPASSVRRSASR